MTRVLHATWSGKYAGLLSQIVTRQMSETDVQLTVLFCTDEEGGHAKDLRLRGVQVQTLNMRSKYGLLSNLYGLFRLHKLLHGRDFDVIHMQEIILPFIFLALRHRCRTARLVLHSRGEFPFARQTPFRATFFLLKKLLYRVLVNSYVDVLVTNSDFITRHMISLGIRPQLIVRLHNATDLSRIDAIRSRRLEIGKRIKEELRIGEDVPILSTAARLEGLKRIDLLLEAMAKLQDTTAQLLVLGDGPMMGSLKRHTQRLGLGERVTFLGHRHDALEWIATSNAFVLPTKGEAFGLACLEAILLEIPVFVMQDAGGMCELVEQGRNGWTCSSVDDLAFKVDQHLSGSAHLAHWDYSAFRRRYDIGTYVHELGLMYAGSW
ncbi:MAG: glycosyltransferase [Phycisphaerae bacterium]|nr:glycosyltransferase [Phycisphaerae bacterium]